MERWCNIKFVIIDQLSKLCNMLPQTELDTTFCKQKNTIWNSFSPLFVILFHLKCSIIQVHLECKFVLPFYQLICKHGPKTKKRKIASITGTGKEGRKTKWTSASPRKHALWRNKTKGTLLSQTFRCEPRSEVRI